jgi:class 3 adenylate cyclase/tetratricopeptide (TPR) repeat protein
MTIEAGGREGRSAVSIGRRAELAQLEASLGEAFAGRPRIVVLRGEAGIGKSHLLRAIAGRARERGLLVGVGHGQEQMRVPYLALADALQGWADAGQTSLERARPSELVQAMMRGASAVAGPSSQQAASAQGMVDLARSVVALARAHPLFLGLDDLHWADDETLQLLIQLGFALGDEEQRAAAPVLIVLATRPLAPASPRVRLLLRLLREPICSAIDLDGLDLLDTAALMRAEGLARPGPGAAQSIFENTRGNPLFIKGLLAGARRQAKSAPHEPFDPSLRSLPSDLSAVVAAQIDSADPSVLQLLRRAALLGSRFSLGLLARLAGRELEGLIDELARWPELVRLEGESGELAHPLIRHELLQRTPGQLRARLHAAIADAIEAEGASPGEIEVAHHLLAAGGEVDAMRRLGAIRAAALKLEALCAFGEAARFHAAAAEAEPDPAQRAELHFRAAVCHQRNYDAAPCLEHFAAAEVDFHAVGDRKGAARVVVERARLELYAVQLGKLRDLAPLQRALDELPPGEEVLEGWLECALADAYFYARRPDEGEQHARRALELGRRNRDDRLCCYACGPLGLSLAQAMRYTEAEEAHSMCLEHGLASGGQRLEVIVPRVRRAGVLHMRGQLSEAVADCDAAIEIAERTNEPGEQAFALAHLCSIEASLGRFAGAEELATEMVRLLGRVDGRPWAPLIGVPALAYLRSARGQWDDACVALQALREPGRWVDNVGGAEHVVSTVLEDLIAATSGAPKDDDASSGRRARVERYAQRVGLRTADGMGLAAVCGLAELGVHYQLPWVLQGPREVLALAFERGAVFSTGWPFLIPRVLANLELALGDSERAQRYFETALQVSEQLGARPELSATRVDFARMLAARGERATQRRARDLLAPAIDDLAELGMSPLLRHATNLGAALGLRRTSSPPVAPVSQAEVQLLHQLAVSERYDEVAHRHLLSPQGLRTRAGDALSSMGVPGPLEATAYAIERGLLAPRSPQRGVPLVLLVTDLEGFTPLVERLGDAEAQRVMREHNLLLREQIRDHGGLEVTHTGDGLVACFRSLPEGVTCAISIQQAISNRNARAGTQPLRLRIGLHAGEPLLEEGRLFGAAVIAAVRICSRCEPDHILASELVQTSASGLQSRFVARGAHALKGFAAPMELFEVRWSDAEQFAT